MIKNQNKAQAGIYTEQSSIPVFKHARTQNREEINLKRFILPVGTLLFQGIWISMCINSGGYLLNEALISSCIIVCLLVFKMSESGTSGIRKKTDLN